MPKKFGNHWFRQCYNKDIDVLCETLLLPACRELIYNYVYLFYLLSICQFTLFRMYLEYCRLAYRMFVPRKERSIAGEITAITGAGSGNIIKSFSTYINYKVNNKIKLGYN